MSVLALNHKYLSRISIRMDVLRGLAGMYVLCCQQDLALVAWVGGWCHLPAKAGGWLTHSSGWGWCLRKAWCNFEMNGAAGHG
jgi:hypothetical protein